MPADGIEATAIGRAAALLGRPVGDIGATPADRRTAAGILHDLIVWGLDQGLPDDALRPVETRLAQLAGELLPDDPGLAALVDWWLTAVVGLPPQQLWFASGGQPGSPTQPLPPEVTEAILPGGRPPNLGSDIKSRRFTEDRERLQSLATTVPALSQVAKAQSVVKALNTELTTFLAALDGARQPDTPGPEADGLAEQASGLGDRADALLRTSGVVEGTPLYGKVRRELEERVTLARAVAARAGNVGPPLEPLPAARVKALTRQAATGDQVLAGRLLAAMGGPQPRPEPSGLAVALAEAMDALEADDRFRAHQLLGAVAEPVSAAAEDPQLAAFVEEGRQVRAEALATLEDLQPHAAGDTAELPGLARSALDAGELAEARMWLGELKAAVDAVRARKEAARALDRARNRGVEGWLVDALAAAVDAGDTGAMAALAADVRLLPGMERKVSALAEQAATAPAAPAGEAGGGPVSLVVSTSPATTVKRGWPERMERPAVIKPVAAYVIRVNAHNRFFDGRICGAPAGNRQCASSERFKLDFCEKGVRRCSWLAAFADQPRVELTDPFVDEYQPVIDELPPEAGDVAVLWASTESGNELVGLWRVLTLAKARRGWVLNGDRDAAVLLPKGVVPWSAVYRRWSSPRGSMALRTLDTAGLEGLLVEVRDALAPLADADPQVQRDLAALEIMLADQRGRVPGAPRPEVPASAAPVEVTPGRGRRGRRRDGSTEQARNGNGQTETAAAAAASGATATKPEAAVDKPPNLHQRLRARGGFYAPTLVAQYELAVRESRLVVLAGPSGTGKTRLALEAAAELGAVSCLVAVRPDWHANEDLLGYLPPFPGSRFSSTAASEFIRSAGIEAEAAAAEQRPPRPFHLCLDEMNLARPEHYLAELLSKMEVPAGRVTFHTGGTETGFPPEVAYPPNLVIIGTVNLDETTLPISAKILDRASYLVVEAHDLRGYLDTLPEAKQVPDWIPKLLVDLDGSLDDAGQGLGYRVAQRLLRWASLGTADGHTPEETLDWAFAAQVVPRLRFTRSDPSHLEVLEAIIGRLRGAKGEFHRSTALLDRMLAELRRQDFTLGQMRLS
jgi:hypothetical protein